ncbi:hypothetical protein [Paramicrobacterium fandaimingii]|nr:hypothetical protein [Microbacterium fandaimingii]
MDALRGSGAYCIQYSLILIVLGASDVRASESNPYPLIEVHGWT